MNGFIRCAKNDYLMQTWQMLFCSQPDAPPHRKLIGVKSTVSDFAKWLVCIPEIIKLVLVFCGKTRRSAVFVGELTERYPEYPIWLRRCWGIAVVTRVSGSDDEECIREMLGDGRFDTVLMTDDAPFGMIEKIARENGSSVIYVDQELSRGKYLMRRDMRKSVNNYMSIVLEEKPIREELINKDRV